jgi:hypothetical protein
MDRKGNDVLDVYNIDILKFREKAKSNRKTLEGAVHATVISSEVPLEEAQRSFS